MVFYIHPLRKNWSFMTASSSLEYFEQQFRYQHLNNSPILRVIHLYYIAKKKIGFSCPVKLTQLFPIKTSNFSFFFFPNQVWSKKKKSKNKLKNFKNSFQKLPGSYYISDHHSCQFYGIWTLRRSLKTFTRESTP